jgi:hypothetical protein
LQGSFQCLTVLLDGNQRGSERRFISRWGWPNVCIPVFRAVAVVQGLALSQVRTELKTPSEEILLVTIDKNGSQAVISFTR